MIDPGPGCKTTEFDSWDLSAWIPPGTDPGCPSRLPHSDCGFLELFRVKGGFHSQIFRPSAADLRLKRKLRFPAFKLSGEW